MGSSSKKHKKDSKKKKHRSHSRSRSISVERDRERDRYGEVDSRDSRDYRERDRERRHHKRDVREYRSRSRSRDDDRRHKNHKVKKHKHRRREDVTVTVNDSDESSSDCVEVPMAAPPAPVITKPSPSLSPPSRRKSSSPENTEGAGDVLSIEETNKLRAKLGLKPLEVNTGPVEPSTSDKAKNPEGLSTYKDDWGEFLHKPADDLAEKAEVKKIREKLEQRKEKRKIEEKLLKVKTLGESDDEDDVDDAKKWVSSMKKKEELQKEAEKRAKLLEEMDEEFGASTETEKRKPKSKNYKDKDLAGLTVDHDMDDFQEGKSVILTLKDKDVLDEENGDTLVNVNMLDDERYKKNVENKKLNPHSYGYDVYEEQYDEFGYPIERDILGKYNDEIGKKTKKNFTIGESLVEEIEHKRKLLEIKTKLAGKKLETLEDAKITLASDTFSEAEIQAKFKKPKKKIKKLRQKLKADDLLGSAPKESKDFGSRRHHFSDDEEMPEKKPNIKIDPDEEDDLQKVLSKARRLKQKEGLIQKTLNPDEIKTEIKEEPSEDVKEPIASNMMLNATAEFCRTLGDIPTYGMAGNRDEDTNDIMDFEMEQDQDIVVHPTLNNSEQISGGTWNSVDPQFETRGMDEVVNISDDELSDVAILDEEPDVGTGIGNALRLAMSKGYLEKEDQNRPSNTKMAHLQAKNYSIEDKSYTEDDKFNRRDRYQAGPIMDFRDKSNFNPNVKLEYIDDNGRILNAKEAFRYLSHKFHGKGPGKNKIEKRLKKLEQESLMKTMSSTDTPLGTLTMLQQKQKETKTAYVVLSGNKQSSMGSISKHK